MKRPAEAHRDSSDGWLYTAPPLALLHLILFITLHARPGLPGVVLWQIGPIVLTFLAVLAMACGLLRSIRARLTWTAGRAAGCAALLVISAMPLTYRTYPSSRDYRPSDIRFRLPLDGPVTVLWGGPTRNVNYHVFAPPERWGYDLAVTREGRSFEAEGTALTDYYAFGVPVLAPAAGTVRDVSDGTADTAIGARGGWRNPCGNHVVIAVALGEFLFLCHLQAGSVTVAADEAVAAGQQVGRAGNSGRSTQPHVHVHLQTTPDAQFGEGVPLFFHDYLFEGRVVERGMPTGGRYPQTVEHARAPAAGLQAQGSARTATRPTTRNQFTRPPSARTNPIDCPDPDRRQPRHDPDRERHRHVGFPLFGRTDPLQPGASRWRTSSAASSDASDLPRASASSSRSAQAQDLYVLCVWGVAR